MQSDRPIIVDLADSQHPKLGQSQHNERTPLLRLPQEVRRPIWYKVTLMRSNRHRDLQIRRMIFSYAVCTDKPVIPQRLGPGSNKFRPMKTMRQSYGPVQYFPLKEPLTVSQLNQTCRRIYSDLVEFLDFYSNNEFQFANITALVLFLVAITPTRRRTICYITVYEDSVYEDGDSHPSRFKCLIPLLCQCTSLRRLLCMDLTLKIRDPINYTTSYRIAWIKHHLRKKLNKFQSTTENSWALCNLPHFQLSVTIPEVPCTVSDRTEIIILLARVMRHINLRQQKVMQEHEQRVGLVSRIKDKHLSSAITLGDIDFPGEVRITRDKFNSTYGTIASRTRQQCVNKTKAAKVGVVTPEDNKGSRDKYDCQGMLKWPDTIYLISKISWCDTGIECQIVPSPYYKSQFTNILLTAHDYEILLGHMFVTEPLDRLLTWTGMLQLDWYYRNIDEESRSATDFTSRLNKLKSMPSPKDIMAYGNDTFKAWARDPESPKSTFKSHDAKWRAFERNFRRNIKRLEKNAAASETKLAKEAQRTAAS